MSAFPTHNVLSRNDSGDIGFNEIAWIFGTVQCVYFTARTGVFFAVQVDQTFDVRGVGSVLSGTVLSGQIFLGQHLWLGPADTGSFSAVSVTGIQREQVRPHHLCTAPSFNLYSCLEKRLGHAALLQHCILMSAGQNWQRQYSVGNRRQPHLLHGLMS